MIIGIFNLLLTNILYIFFEFFLQVCPDLEEIFIALEVHMDRPDQNIVSSWTWRQKRGRELRIYMSVSFFFKVEAHWATKLKKNSGQTNL